MNNPMMMNNNPMMNMNMMNMMNNNNINHINNVIPITPIYNNNVNSNSNINNNNANLYQPKDLIQRGNQSITYDAYPGRSPSQRINVVMAASSGLRIVMNAPADTPIRDHIRKYLQKVNLGEGVLNGQLIFLINASTINVNSYDRLDSICVGNANVITVIDAQNVIAAGN